MNHEPHTENHPNRYGYPSPPLLAIRKFKHGNSLRKIVWMPPSGSALSRRQTTDDVLSAVDDHHLPAGLAGLMTRCASRISSKPNTRAGLAFSRPAATCWAISCSGTSDSGNPGVPNTKLPKKVR